MAAEGVAVVLKEAAEEVALEVMEIGIKMNTIIKAVMTKKAIVIIIKKSIARMNSRKMIDHISINKAMKRSTKKNQRERRRASTKINNNKMKSKRRRLSLRNNLISL